MAKINRFWPALVSRLIIAISSLREIVLVGWVYFNKIQSPWKNYVRFHYYLLYCYCTEPAFPSAPRSSPAGLDLASSQALTARHWIQPTGLVELNEVFQGVSLTSTVTLKLEIVKTARLTYKSRPVGGCAEQSRLPLRCW